MRLERERIRKEVVTMDWKENFEEVFDLDKTERIM